MSMKIKINARDENELIQHMRVLGFYKAGTIAVPEAPKYDSKAPLSPLHSAIITSADTIMAVRENGETTNINVEEAAPANLAGPARIPGQPSEGRKRRTRAEVVEDEAYFAAHPETREGRYVITGQSGVEAVSLGISTGEERIDPEAAAQDADDEAAESAQHKTGELTTEDLREVIGLYSQRHGIAAAQKDIPALLGGKGIHEIDKTQEALKAAIDAVRAALDGKQTMEPPGDNLFGDDKPVAVEETHATKDDVMEAIRGYRNKYDGPAVDLAQAKNVLADIPVVLEKALGVKTLKQIPPDPVSYGKALRAINEAVSGNPFGREIVK